MGLISQLMDERKSIKGNQNFSKILRRAIKSKDLEPAWREFRVENNDSRTQIVKDHL